MLLFFELLPIRKEDPLVQVFILLFSYICYDFFLYRNAACFKILPGLGPTQDT